MSPTDSPTTGSSGNADAANHSAGTSSPPAGLAAFLSNDVRLIESLVVEQASADAVATLRRAGVRSILLKGPLQQRWLGDTGPPRASIDVDLLVATAEFDAAESAIAATGYSSAVLLPSDPGFEHARIWVAPNRVPIELHWTIVGADERRTWEVFAAETETEQIAGEFVEIPNEAARCLIVALHAAQHGAGETKIFHDLERALRVAGASSWARAHELAVAVGAETLFVAVLDLSVEGRALRDALGLEPPALTDREALALLTPAPAARGFYGLSEHRGVAAKTRYLLGKLAPSPAFMRLRYPLARRGLLGMLAAYLYRPFWLARWAIPGLRSWRRAQRLARESRSREL